MWQSFHSLPCLTGLLPEEYISLGVLLVQLSYILLQKSISKDVLNECDRLMISCVGKVQLLYGSAALTFNVHSWGAFHQAFCQ